eukprot:GHVN01098913.1.p4 GENE.GHVN01098913.1~~GHVN01098913.1.p4  ORF type:complete len:108 (-),score=16.59 GHVN01098913.1:1442-1765(-)
MTTPPLNETAMIVVPVETDLELTPASFITGIDPDFNAMALLSPSSSSIVSNATGIVIFQLIRGGPKMFSADSFMFKAFKIEKTAQKWDLKSPHSHSLMVCKKGRTAI